MTDETNTGSTFTLITDGDSLTTGNATNPDGNWPQITQSQLHLPVRLHNIAIPGDTLCNRTRRFPETVSPLLNGGTERTILHIAAGSNDLAGMMEGADRADYLFSHLQLYCHQARDAGLRIVVATIPPRIQFLLDPIREAARLTFNERLRRAWPDHAAALADWAADPLVGAADYPLNTELCPDGIHPTQTGLIRLAAISAAAITQVLETDG